jgi:hypothetical protein
MGLQTFGAKSKRKNNVKLEESFQTGTVITLPDP